MCEGIRRAEGGRDQSRPYTGSTVSFQTRGAIRCARVRDFFSRGDSSQLSVIRFSIPAFPQNQTACGQGASPGSGLTRPRCRSLPQQTVAARRAALRTLADGFQPRGDPPEKLVPRCNQVGDDGNRICPCI